MKRIRTMLPVALLLMVTTLLSSCKEVFGWLDNPVGAHLTVKVESATLVPGETVDLGATTISTSPIKYATSDKEIATVDEKGTVTAVAEGSAIITVSVAANETYAAATKQVTITVEGDKATPMTLEAVEAGTITINNPGGLTIKFSKNGAAKEEFNTTKEIEVTKGDKVQFYGNNNYYSKGFAFYTTIQCTADTYVYGNFMSLIKENGFDKETKLTDEFTFFYLFYGNTKIKNHPKKNIVLPATELTYHCYQWLFKGCTGLTRVPELPATKLAKACYSNMFQDCTGLTKAPELPATKIESECYYGMFQGCTGLTEAPELPATELARYCYDSMFENCSSLTKAPKLPATELTERCYFEMFKGCSKLEEVWVKAAFSDVDLKCYFMFRDAGVDGAKLHTLSANVASWNDTYSFHMGNFTADDGWTD